MKKRIKKKIEKRGGSKSTKINSAAQASKIDVHTATDKRILKQVQSILANELNKTVSLYTKSGLDLPKTLKDQMDGKSFSKMTVSNRNLSAIKDNIAIMQQTVNKSEMSTENKRKQFLDRFKREITGSDLRKDGTRKKYDVYGSLFRNEMKDFIDDITIEQLLKIYDIIEKMEQDKSYRYGKYKSGDFDAMVVATSKGYNPTKMKVDDFLDKVYEMQKSKEKEKDEYVLSQAPKTTLFD
jgi:hypothetical protein